MRIGGVRGLTFLRAAALVLVYAFAGVAVAGLAPVVVAQDGGSIRQDTSGARATAAAERRSPVRIDGRPDEGAWTAAPAATSFVPEPIEGAPAQYRTEVSRPAIDAIV